MIASNIMQLRGGRRWMAAGKMERMLACTCSQRWHNTSTRHCASSDWLSCPHLDIALCMLQHGEQHMATKHGGVLLRAQATQPAVRMAPVLVLIPAVVAAVASLAAGALHVHARKAHQTC